MCFSYYLKKNITEIKYRMQPKLKECSEEKKKKRNQRTSWSHSWSSEVTSTWAIRTVLSHPFHQSSESWEQHEERSSWWFLPYLIHLVHFLEYHNSLCATPAASLWILHSVTSSMLNVIWGGQAGWRRVAFAVEKDVAGKCENGNIFCIGNQRRWCRPSTRAFKAL